VVGTIFFSSTRRPPRLLEGMLDSEVVFTRRWWRWYCSVLVDGSAREALCSFVCGHVGGTTSCVSCVSFGSGGVGGAGGAG